MAYFSAAPTLCEVTYDRNNDERHTPYRYQCRSATTRIGTGSLSPTFTDTATFSLPSGFNVSYYEYLRTLYDSRISNSTKTSGYHGSGQSPGYMSARNVYGHSTYPTSLSVQEGRPKTASPYAQTDGRSSYPHPSSLPMIHHGWGPPNDGDEEASGEGHKSMEERLQWVDALNKWIPEHSQNRPGYLTFVGNAPMVDKLLREVQAQREKEREIQHAREMCERYEQHMSGLEHRIKTHSKSLHPENSFAQRLMTLKKREALRKKANEMLELKRQQQRESSALSDKRNRVRFHTPNYQPKPKPYSPVRREPINVPKDPADHEVTESEVSSHITQSDVDTARSKPPEVDEEVEAEVEAEEKESPSNENMAVESSNMSTEQESAKESKSSVSLLPQIAMETERPDVAEAEVSEPVKLQKKKRVVISDVIEGNDDAKNDILPQLSPKIDQSPDSKKPKKSSSKSTTKVKVPAESKPKRSKSKSKLDKQSNKPAKAVKEKIEKEEEKPVVEVIEEVQTIPTIGDTKTGPLSLTGGRESPLKKTRILSPLGMIIEWEESEHEEDLTLEQSPPLDVEDEMSIGSKLTQKEQLSSDSRLLVLDGQNGHLLTKQRCSMQYPRLLGTLREEPVLILEDVPTAINVNVHVEPPKEQPKEPVPMLRRVSIDEVQKKRRESLFAKKKRPSPPPPPTPPRTPTPPPVEEPEVEEPPVEIQTDVSNVIDNALMPASVTPEPIGLPVVDIAEPALPDPSTFLKQTSSASKNKRVTITTPILKLQQKLQKGRKFARDTSYEDELRRQELAEKRKQKQMEMLEKMKSRRSQMGSELGQDDDMPNFEDYGFLAKYCIFNKANIEMYRHTFDAVDMDGRGKLSGIETMIALRGVNHKLTMHEEEYLYRIMELTGYNISQGADFKLFSVLAALSQRISALDNWMKNLIGAMDWGTLEMKMFMCKTLWECNVDKETNKIPLDQLCVELRAGGVSQKHENEVREKLRHLDALDLLDFLTYVPLFIMIHESVVDNPLSDVRDK